jgi:hypothetical protein
MILSRGGADKKLLRGEMVLLRDLKELLSTSSDVAGSNGDSRTGDISPRPLLKSLPNPGLHSARLKLASLAQG